MAVVTETHVALFELKIAAKGAEGAAMRQLRERDHAKRYRALGVPIRLVAVESDPGERNIAGLDVADA